MAGNTMAKVCFWGCMFVITIVGISILSASFVYVEYDELAFPKNTLQNKVDSSETHENGRYCWGPNYDVLSFKRLFKRMSFSGNSVLSVANSEGVSIKVEVDFMYRIKKSTLRQLYKKYGTSYESKARAIAQTVLKNVAVKYTMNQWLTKREMIARQMGRNVSTALREIWIDAPANKLALGEIEFSERIKDKFLAAAVQLEENEQREFEQVAAVIREETSKLVEEINKNTTVVLRTAEANKLKTVEVAKAQANHIVSSAKGLGIASVIANLSLDYDYGNNTARATFLKLMAVLDNVETKLVASDACMLLNT